MKCTESLVLIPPNYEAVCNFCYLRDDCIVGPHGPFKTVKNSFKVCQCFFQS